MTKSEWDSLRKTWDEMNDGQRWKFLYNNQQFGLIINLDNDMTFVTHKDIEDEFLDFRQDIGWRDGVLDLLSAFNIKAEQV